MVSLYFHIPLCTKKCPYCHFYVIPNNLKFHTLLTEGLLLEIEHQAHLLTDEVVSIYFGGGTPSLFPRGIRRVLEELKRRGISLSRDCEITVEANPEEGSHELFSSLLEMGVNRLSLGVQSLDDRSLQTLERIHSAKKAKQTISQAFQAGFKNISIDLMYDLPDQTPSSWEYTLSQIEELKIQHLSLYNLTIEPHTSFAKRKLKQPNGKASLGLLESGIKALESIGLNRYEISAFSKLGFQSKHNLGYWTGRPFLGFGPSAFSFWEGKRFRNIPNIQRYVRFLKNGMSPIDFEEELPFPQNAKEKFAVGLRVFTGVQYDDSTPKEIVESVEKLIDQKLLCKNKTTVFLSERGRLFYDTVASEII